MTRLRGAIGLALAAGLVTAIAPATQAQETLGIDSLVLAFDDPTLLARTIDERVASGLAACMKDEGFDYVVAADARFNLERVETQDEVSPELDLSVRELVPRVVEPGVFDSSLIDPDLEVEVPDAPRVPPSRVDPRLASARGVEDLPPLVDPGRSDPGLRLRPRTEGYGVSLNAFEVEVQDPNLDIVRQLDVEERRSYETALYGRPVVEITEGTQVGGCAAGVQAMLDDEIIPKLRQLDADLEALRMRIESDPGYGDAIARWSRCLEDTDVGRRLGLRSPNEAVALANARFDEVRDGDQAGLAEVRGFERDLAEADYACRATTTDPAIAAVLLTDGGRFAGRTLDVVAELAEGAG